MSRRANLNWRSGNRLEENDNRSQTANSGTNSNRPNPVPQALVHQPDDRGGMLDRRSSFEHGVRSGPFDLSRRPLQPPSPIRVFILDGGTAEMMNPRFQRFIGDSPPRIRDQWGMGFTPHQEEPGLSHAEFKKAMSKLRKHVFNPAYPRKRAYKRGLFSGTSISQNNRVDKDDDDDDGKDCTICLEEFVPNQQVLVTPCNHMFHKECITPWVKSHGKCPVCRFVLGQQRDQSRSNNTANINETLNLNALIWAMEAAMAWGDVPPY